MSRAPASRCAGAPRCTGTTARRSTHGPKHASAPAALVTTRAPILASASITPYMASSLPGISDEDRMIRSPAVSVMLRCSPRDILDSADIGSPWVPVVISTTRSGGIISAAAMSRMSESATRRYPSSLAMPMLRTIDRPTNDTRLPSATAASVICCTRSTFDAKHATITRPSAPRIKPVQRRADLAFRRAPPLGSRNSLSRRGTDPPRRRPTATFRADRSACRPAAADRV